MILVGYEPKRKAYRLWLPGTNKIEVSPDVIIVEPTLKQQAVLVLTDVCKSHDPESNSQEKIEGPSVEAKQNRKIIEENEPIAHRTRSQTKETQWKDTANSGIQSKLHTHLAVSVMAFMANVTIPQTVEEAWELPNRTQWEQAMIQEIEALKQNDTYTLVEPPPDCKPIKNKWIFRIKTNPDGSLDKYKARLVIKGCSLREGVDFDETYSPVTRLESIRTLFSIAAVNDLEVYQMDVKSVFLNGRLEELIYMEQPNGFVDSTNRVCKLNKALYGFPQAPRAWHSRFDIFMKKFGLKSTTADPCVYANESGDIFVTL